MQPIGNLYISFTIQMLNPFASLIQQNWKAAPLPCDSDLLSCRLVEQGHFEWGLRSVDRQQDSSAIVKGVSSFAARIPVLWAPWLPTNSHNSVPYSCHFKYKTRVCQIIHWLKDPFLLRIAAIELVMTNYSNSDCCQERKPFLHAILNNLEVGFTVHMDELYMECCVSCLWQQFRNYIALQSYFLKREQCERSNHIGHAVNLFGLVPYKSIMPVMYSRVV